ncbi:MAG: type II secretion system F family protein [Syntrophaceae bacterium]
MPVFSYRATDMEGAIAEGSIDAADERSAVEILRDRGIIPLAVELPRESMFLKLASRSYDADLLIFTIELSALLNAGLPLDRSLQILAEITESGQMKEVVGAVLKSIRGGASFSDALGKNRKVFPKIYVNMVKAGETGGILPPVLERLAEFLESRRDLRAQVISAMIYPCVLLATGGLSIIILLTFVLPRFSAVFAETGSALPFSTQVLLAVSGFLKSYGWCVIPLIALAWAALRYLNSSEKGRLKLDALKLKFMGDLVRKLETARFCRTLGTLIGNGVPLLQALGNSRDVIGNQVIASAVNTVSEGARQGKGISLPLAATGVFPPLALSMIKVGEETGQLETMLIRIAVTYEKALKEAVRRFISVLEPALILAMGMIIGFIVISVLVAVFSITDLPF